MAKDTVKSPKPGTAKSKTLVRRDSTPHEDELTEEQLQKASGGGGGPTTVRDRT
jgi:hypothetical protein